MAHSPVCLVIFELPGMQYSQERKECMFKDEVMKLIKKAPDGTLSCNLTDEQKQAIKRVQTAANAETQTMVSSAVVKQVEIAAAIEARATRSSSQDVSGVYADEIHMEDHNQQLHIYPCTVAKSTNIVTSSLVEANVLKIYATVRMTHSTKGAAARNYIRDDWGKIFSKARVVNDPDKLIKQASMKDTVLSATIFPADVRLSEEFTAAIEVSIALKTGMMAEFLKGLRGADETAVKTAYRNINRSLLDDIFDSVYSAYIGRVDDSDPEAVQLYLDALRDYRDSVGQIGSVFLSSDTAEFGLNVRRLSISPNVIWQNREKTGRIKRYGSGSYYVSTNEDTGIGRIPTTPEILADHIDEIVSLTDHCMALVECEARLENGYNPIEIPALPDLPRVPDSLKYSDLLGITRETEASILSSIETEAKELATVVCKRRKSAKSDANVGRIMEAMGR